MSAAGVGAVVGLLVGVTASISVGMRDLRKRQAGLRVQAEYRGSLFVTPALLAGAGALVGLGVANIF
ncbi:MAG: hypothetical protein ACT4OX_10605 [Actinomycetota bacterium]